MAAPSVDRESYRSFGGWATAKKVTICLRKDLIREWTQHPRDLDWYKAAREGFGLLPEEVAPPAADLECAGWGSANGADDFDPEEFYGDIPPEFRRPFGLAEGKVVVGPKFNDPLPPNKRLFAL